MSAVAEIEIGPSGLGHELLEAWAPWVRDDNDDRHSWNVKPRVAKGYQGDMPESVRITDKIIAKQKLQSHADWRVIARYYLDEQEIWQVARELSWGESRVRVRLAAICGLIEREYRDWYEFTRGKR